MNVHHLHSHPAAHSQVLFPIFSTGSPTSEPVHTSQGLALLLRPLPQGVCPERPPPDHPECSLTSLPYPSPQHLLLPHLILRISDGFFLPALLEFKLYEGHDPV